MKDTNVEINLKQSDIEKAVKQHVANQGFNLTGKIVTISFSQTRKGEDAGVQAAVNIEDAADVQIPGYTDRNADPVQSATVHTLAAATVNNPAVSYSATNESASNSAEGEVKVAEDSETKPEVVEGAEAKAEVTHPASTNLFGDD